ncbi:lycopene cyclase domain-containing protein [Sorangium sp. So ce1153]|uniref:lycopene cyclase domain-containing protein n=1 Tax=Sorangium sp. So ce1153 TaxID=3133333 RepID=UPI003F5DBA03
MKHEFLLLSLLFLLPAGVIWHVRPDLRALMKRMALASTPFAATERLFYPEYWTPKFLFDLADRIGFGVEDVLFLAGLSAFASTAYAVVFRRAPVPCSPPPARPWSRLDRPWSRLDRPWLRAARPWLRAAAAIASALAAARALLAVGVPVLYAAVAAMMAVAAALLAARGDLLVPTVLGALLSAAVYLGLCLVFAALVPGVFERTWRPSVLLPGRALLGVPLDEILYGLGAGFAATVFPAWAFEFRYARAARVSSALPPRARGD